MMLARRTAVATMAALIVAGADRAETAAARSAHAFSFEAIDGGTIALADYAGKAILVVNSASFCGFTRQYAELQALWQAGRDRGLVVIGVPSNDFGGQEPGTNGEIKDFCEVNFAIDFPMAAKVHVRGPNAHPFYAWVRDELGAEASPRWNFHKYLIGADGTIVGWFPSTTAPSAQPLRDAVEAALPVADAAAR